MQETEAFLLVRLHEQESRGFAEWAAEDAGNGRLIGSIGLSEPTSLPEVMPAVRWAAPRSRRLATRDCATEGAVAALDPYGFSTLGSTRSSVSANPPTSPRSGSCCASG